MQCKVVNKFAATYYGIIINFYDFNPLATVLILILYTPGTVLI
jgi:hypothetical protein